MDSSSPPAIVERTGELAIGEMAEVKAVQNGGLSSEGYVCGNVDAIETDSLSAVSSKVTESAVNHTTSETEDIGGRLNRKSIDGGDIVEDADKEKQCTDTDKVGRSPVNGEESGVFATKNAKKFPVVLKGACVENGFDEISNDSKFDEEPGTEAAVGQRLEEKKNCPDHNLSDFDNGDTLIEKKGEETLAEKESDEKSEGELCKKGKESGENSSYSAEESSCPKVDRENVNKDLSEEDCGYQNDDSAPRFVSENETLTATEIKSNIEEQNVIEGMGDGETNSQSEEDTNCDLFVFTMKEGKESDKSDDSILSAEEKEGKDVNCGKKMLPQPVFEDITEDEDSDEEQFENIELELDDLIDTPDTSANSDSKGGISDSVGKNSEKQLEENEQSVANTSMNTPVVNSEIKDVGNSQTVNVPRDKLDLGTKSCENVDPSVVTEQINTGKERVVVKKKSTARKSGTPVSQTESAPLKRINMHPIKNVTMSISEVEEALKYDLDCAKRMKKSENISSTTATTVGSGQGNTYKVISVTKSNTALRKKRKKRGYDFPGCKKKQKKSRLSDDVASPGASSIDSVSLSESDLMESDRSSCSSTIPLSEYSHQVSDHQQSDSTIPTSAFSSSTSSFSSTLLPSSSCLPLPPSSSTSSKLVKSSKIKSVLDMLHERNRQQAAIDTDGPSTTSTTTTTTTIMVSPPPNKPIIEGVKRKGTPRKRREDVICVSDDDDKDDLLWKAKQGKRNSVDSISSSGSSTTTVTAKSKLPNNITSPGHAPVVMMVAQHSSNPSLRSLLPRNMIVTSPTQIAAASGGVMRQVNPIAGAPPGSLLAPMPLVSTLPMGMKAMSMANLPGGVTAFPLTSLPPGSTIFTAVQANPGVQPIPGATLLNITPPTKPPKSMSKSLTLSHSSSSKSSKSSKSKHSLLSQFKKIPTSASSSSSSLSSSSAAAATQQAVNSESLRALLVGKSYPLGHHLTPTSMPSLLSSSSSSLTSSSSSIISSTPVVLQMLTSSNKTSPNTLATTTLVPLPGGHHHQPISLAAAMPPQSQSLIRSASSSLLVSSTAVTTSTKSNNNYSVIKPHYSMIPPPNGVSCLTPPKTPDTDSSSEVAVAASLTRPVGVGGQCEDSDVIPLCCCKITVPSFNKLLSGTTYCQALDSVDNKVLGCCNKVTSSQLIRPGVKIPFMAVCESHRKRLRLHQCCPGCGHFCSQGKFQQCRKEGTNSTHHFHKQCMFYRGAKHFCPHCGEETSLCEVELKLNEDGTAATTQPARLTSRGGKNKDDKKGSARFSQASKKNKLAAVNEDGKSFTLPNKKSINASLLPVGPDQASLIRLCKYIGEDRPKKYRTLSKDLYTPSLEGDMDKVFYLLLDEMDPNTRHEDHEDQTALHAAAISGNLGTVFVLQQWGAEIHAQDRSLRTPLMCAAENGFAKVVQFLLKAGAKVEDRGEDGMTSLHYAAKAGYIDVIKVLLNTRKLDVNVQDDGGWTPIIWATESMLPDIVHYLISQGGDPNKKDNEENTGLHWSAFSGSVDIAEMFLDLGCELDTPNEHGDRALHIAARQDHYDIVVHLLARGANVDVKNHKDETPVEACVNKTGQVSMALKVNQQLRSFAAYKLIQPERLLERDITMGREKNPIACVNKEDNELCPTDYLYIVQNVETTPLNINCVITGLQSCRCKDDCSSMYCVCARSSVCCWYDKTGRLVDDFNLLEPPLLFECNRACRCWVNCNNRVVQNGIVCRLQLFRTNGRGWGVRTLMDIPKGTFVCEYIGELISDSEADRREDDSYLFDLDNKDGDTYCIDARKYGNIARFINHLCEPNLVPVKVFVEHQDLRFPRICFFSSREIKAYEELGFDYGEKFWVIKWKHFTCACQSAKCKYSKDTIQKTLDYYKLRYPDEPTGQEPA